MPTLGAGKVKPTSLVARITENVAGNGWFRNPFIPEPPQLFPQKQNRHPLDMPSNKGTDINTYKVTAMRRKDYINHRNQQQPPKGRNSNIVWKLNNLVEN